MLLAGTLPNALVSDGDNVTREAPGGTLGGEAARWATTGASSGAAAETDSSSRASEGQKLQGGL